MLYKVFYTDKFIPRRYGGRAYGPIILIRPRYIGDEGLLEHEKVHVRQFWHGLGIFFVMKYYLSASSRLKYEVEAYKEQMKYSGKELAPTFARFITTKYNLDISYEKALKLLRA